jgi:uncharacterized membrane protein YhhN
MTSKQCQYWLAAFITSSGLYLTCHHLDLFGLGWILKIIPILLLIGYVWLRLKGQPRLFLLLGLIFSLTGDVLLSLDGLFIQGLGAFLLAQLTYATLFFKQARLSTQGAVFGCAILMFIVIAAWQIVPHTGEMKWVVLAYMGAISLMAISAGFRADPHFLLTALGAATFMLSDTLIAVNKFVAPFPWAGIAIMLTYYLAQLTIILGISRHWLSQQAAHN